MGSLDEAPGGVIGCTSMPEPRAEGAVAVREPSRQRATLGSKSTTLWGFPIKSTWATVRA